MSKIQIVDAEDRPVGSSSKTKAWRQGLVRRVIRIMVEDGAGRVLLQKRHPRKNPFPGRWDCSVAGHVDADESYAEAARRELAEEIGIRDLELREIDKYYAEAADGWRQLKSFATVYKATVDASQRFYPQPSEATSVKWFTVDEIKRLLKDQPDQISDGLGEVVERYY